MNTMLLDASAIETDAAYLQQLADAVVLDALLDDPMDVLTTNVIQQRLDGTNFFVIDDL
jgi:hypothetical protein